MVLQLLPLIHIDRTEDLQDLSERLTLKRVHSIMLHQPIIIHYGQPTSKRH